jgi:hypothetical protein
MPRGTDDRPYGSLELPALRGAATTAVATAAAATTTATGALLSFVDAERAAAQVLAIEALDREDGPCHDR